VTVESFEGPAGSGKTFRLIERTREIVNAGFLKEGQRVLALTFMNGARRRLEASLGNHTELRRRFECKTVDVFAQAIVARRRSPLAASAFEVPAAAKENEFNPTCFLAGRLLESDAVANWVAASYPLVLIDEAQDLDAFRFPIVQRLAPSCTILAAADAFQCLGNGVDAGPIIAWLNSFGNTTSFNGSRRTSQSGILQAAQAVRNGQDICAVLKKHQKYPTWTAPGFKLIEFAGRFPFLAWTISNELRTLSGNVAILTPNTTDGTIRKAIEMVCVRDWPFKKERPDVTFGPYPVEWDVNETERAQDLCKQLELPEMCSLQNISAGGATMSDPAIMRVRARMQRVSRVSGERAFSSTRISEMINDAVRDVSRFGGRHGPLRAAMSIHRAKNREFKNIIVLWPYGVPDGEEYLRRLLYNGITRAQQNCVVIALGKNRLCAPPFAPARPQVEDAIAPRRRKVRGKDRPQRISGKAS
jgi:hypothetical protein